MSEWQPIATAPTGMRALFYLDWADDCRDLNPALPVNAERVELTVRGVWPLVFKATHWMSLPAPPEVGFSNPDAVARSVTSQVEPTPRAADPSSDFRTPDSRQQDA